MLRKIVNKPFNKDLRYVEIYCLSTDTKPTTGIVTGSFCMEVDTGKTFLFNEEAASDSKWVEQNSED